MISKSETSIKSLGEPALVSIIQYHPQYDPRSVVAAYSELHKRGINLGPLRQQDWEEFVEANKSLTALMDIPTLSTTLLNGDDQEGNWKMNSDKASEHLKDGILEQRRNDQLAKIEENTRVIKIWVSFFGIITVLSIIASIIIFLG